MLTHFLLKNECFTISFVVVSVWIAQSSHSIMHKIKMIEYGLISLISIAAVVYAAKLDVTEYTHEDDRVIVLDANNFENEVYNSKTTMYMQFFGTIYFQFASKSKKFLFIFGCPCLSRMVSCLQTIRTNMEKSG